MKRYFGLIAALFYFCPVCSSAQTVDPLEGDSVFISEGFVFPLDTIYMDSLVNTEIQIMPVVFSPEPRKAIIYSLLFPGLGQIYNRKYWKLPLVYGSFLGCAYAITWNGVQHSGYKNAYIDFISADPRRRWEDYRYGEYRRTEYEDWTESMKTQFANTLRSARDYHRRNRDLSYIVTAGVYAIWIIDAYVDAHLFNFDISPDLSMRVEPMLFDRTPIQARSFGMQLSFAF